MLCKQKGVGKVGVEKTLRCSDRAGMKSEPLWNDSSIIHISAIKSVIVGIWSGLLLAENTLSMCVSYSCVHISEHRCIHTVFELLCAYASSSSTVAVVAEQLCFQKAMSRCSWAVGIKS